MNRYVNGFAKLTRSRSSILRILLLLGLSAVVNAGMQAQETPKANPPKPAATKPSARTPRATATTAQTKPATAPAQAAGASRVVVRFGAHKLTAAEFEGMVNFLPPQYQTMARGGAKRRIAEEYAKMLALADEARRRHLDQREPTRTRIEFNVNNMLAATAYQEIQSQTEVSDAETQAYYDAHTSDFERVHARHILVALAGGPAAKADKLELTDEQAKAKAEDLRKQILAGADFAKLAKENSDDSASAEKGGDLGYFRRGQMAPEFEKAAFALKPKELSEPVKSPFGYHLIEVEDHSTTPLADVKTEISSSVKTEKVNRVVTALMGGQPVFDEDYFKPAASPATPPAQPSQPAPPPKP